MRLAPLLLLLVPLALVLLQLLLRWGLQRRSELLRSAHTHRPLQRQDAPIAVEVDVDSSPLFDSPAPREALPHYLVLDTETQDILHEEEVGIEFAPLADYPPLVADAGRYRGACLRRGDASSSARSIPITEGATALHGITTEQMECEGEELRPVLERLLQVVSEAKVLVAHNVRFHRTLVLSELEAAGLPDNFAGGAPHPLHDGAWTSLRLQAPRFG